MSSYSPLRQLRRLDRSSSEFPDQVTDILYGEDYKQWVQTVRDKDLVGLVDYLDKALDNLDPSGSAFRKCLRELRHVCGTRAILPTLFLLSSQGLTVGHQPVSPTSSGDVYEGSFNGKNVCVKRVRIYSKDDSKKATKTFCQETVVWRHLEHRNIVPLIGITLAPLQLISGWMPGGDLAKYIRKDPGADRIGLLCDVAEGLHFLHSRNVVHGDLKGQNILVDDTGHARITDFGLATVTQNLDSMRSTSGDLGHTARWTAPEILSEQGTYSEEADVFSFAMVMIEVFTGAVPFDNNLPAAAMLAIMVGRRPPRPVHHRLTNQLWTLMQHCWDQDPHLRPEVSEVLNILRGSTASLPLRQTAQLAAQKSNYGVPTSSPETKGGNGGEEEDARPHTMSQATVQGPSSAGDHRSRKEQRGQPNGRVGRRPSRRSTDASDTFPAPIDPLPFDPKEKEKGRARNPVYGHTHGARKSSSSLRRTRGDKSGGSLLDVGGVDQKGYHPGRQNISETLGENQDIPPQRTRMHEGEQKLGSKQEDRVGLPSQTNGHHGNVPKPDLSRPPKEHGLWCRLKRFLKMHLLNGLVRRNQEETYPCDERRNGSRTDLLRTPPSRNSRRDTFRVIDGGSTRNAPLPDHDSQAANRYGHRSLVNLGETLPKVKRYLLRVPEDQHGSPRVRGNDRETEDQNISKSRSNPPAWKRLTSRTLPVHERVRLVSSIFSDSNEVKRVRNLRGNDAQAFIDAIDEVLDNLPPHIRRRCLRSLCKICGRQSILPRSLEIPLCYNPQQNPLYYGGFADVWKGKYQGREVAAKVLRVYQTSNLDRIKKRFCREVMTWKGLHHPNVLPLIGVTVTENRFVMVSEWVVKGNIQEFTKSHVNADRLGLLVEVTRGLIYMHDEGVIHGDLRGANILIDQRGHACLTDFSLLAIAAEQSTVIPSCVEGGTIQWMSPELIDPEAFGLKKSLPTKESDCYALGMVIYEVLSGSTPFSPSKAPAVMRKVLDGERPGRPRGKEGSLFTDDIWGVLEHCWKPRPCDRISVRDVFLGLGESGDAGTDIDDQWDATSNDSSD